ncbi:MAG: sorbosone dehydrogenase family protein [Rhodocyclaceae bacterium]|nr:sorbosone dehydrogenase family protein [Rhodocyclaceae bacterium]
MAKRVRAARGRLAALVLAAWSFLPCGAAVAADPGGISRLRVPAGYTIELYASGVSNARQMALLPSGILLVGSRDAGVVSAVLPGASAAERRVLTLAAGFEMPTGIAVHAGDLYIADIGRVLRIRDVEARVAEVARGGPLVRAELLPLRLPPDQHHGWRYLRIDEQGRFIMPIGAPCNVCDRDADGYAQIVRMRPDGSQREVLARGVRNSVGFAIEPGSGQLWFTDNGRDWLGDDLPSCELNRVTQAGQHFGFPFCHQGDVADPKFGRDRACSEFVPPVAKLGAHVAPLSITFWQGDAVVALHGSWNRSRKSGYKVVRVVLDRKVMGDTTVNPVQRVEDLVSGWLQGEYAWGRPADVLALPDGGLLISDDQQGLVYRLHDKK